MGRPRLPPEQRPMKAMVRLRPDTGDYVSRLALSQQRSVYALLGGIIERVIGEYKTRHPLPPCYGVTEPSSTLSTLLSESPSSRASRQSGD